MVGMTWVVYSHCHQGTCFPTSPRMSLPWASTHTVPWREFRPSTGQRKVPLSSIPKAALHWESHQPVKHLPNSQPMECCTIHQMIIPGMAQSQGKHPSTATQPDPHLNIEGRKRRTVCHFYFPRGSVPKWLETENLYIFASFSTVIQLQAVLNSFLCH